MRPISQKKDRYGEKGSFGEKEYSHRQETQYSSRTKIAKVLCLVSVTLWK